MKLIDKDALVSEIERRKEEEVSCDGNGGFSSWADHNHYSTLDSIQDFINTLEVKEVDLEKEIKNGIDNLSNLYCYMEDLYDGNEEEGVYPIPEKVKNELFKFAKNFFELGIKAKENKL